MKNKPQEKTSDLEKAKQLLQKSKEERGKRFMEKFQKLLKEENCSMGARLRVVPNEKSQIEFIVTPND